MAQDRDSQGEPSLEARLLAAVEQAVIATDEDQRIIYWNPFAERIYGWTADEVLGRDINEVTSARPAQGRAPLEKVEAGDAFSGEFEVRRKNGEIFSAFVSVSPLRPADGLGAGAIGVSFDLTDQKERERNAAALLTAMSEGFALCDAIWNAAGELADYTVIQINPALQAMLGADENLLGKRLSQTAFYGPFWLKMCEAVLRDGRPASLEFKNPVTGRTHDIRINRVTPNRIAQFFFDITERKAAEEAQSLLLREMNHRVKNIFSLMSGVVALSGRSSGSPRSMAEAIRGRIEAIAQAHELILPPDLRRQPAGAGHTTLAALATAVLSPYAAAEEPDGAPRLSIAGAEVAVGAGAANALALVLHELATNAVKYGALSGDTGRVAVTWRVEDGFLELRWQERDGPAVSGPPATEGFGSVLARRSVSGQLGGALLQHWAPEGLSVKITAPLDHLTAD
jgi:PAS domain S-box-containing protein